MNIYIKPNVEEKLRRYDGSMSGLVNRLLKSFFDENPAAATGSRREVDKAFEKKTFRKTATEPIARPEPEYIPDEQGNPRSGLESLDAELNKGPLFRNKKKGKL